jgi:uncharacterized protein YpmB
MKKISIFIILLTYLLLAFPVAIALGVWESAEGINEAINRWIKR